MPKIHLLPHLPSKLVKRLEREYSIMTDEELKYEFLQPDCPYCIEAYCSSGMLPVWCPDCCVYRWLGSPLMNELERRHMTPTYLYSLRDRELCREEVDELWRINV